MAYRYRRRDPETGAMELYEDAGRSIPVNFGGMNLTGTPNLDYLQNLANLLQQQQQQGPQLDPDEFGSYSIPASDPTYSSGFDYARSIAGGMPMSQVIAPGVSYSPEQPMGYTQEQLNTAVGTTPVEPPQGTPSPYGVFADDPSYFGTGIGGVTIFDDKDPKAIEHRDIITGKIIGGAANQKPHISHTRFDEMFPQSGLNQIQNLINIDDAPQSYRFDPITRKMVPAEGPDMTGKIIGNNAIPPIPPKINDQIFIDDRPIIDERIVDRGYGPGIMPPLPPMDIDKLIPPVNIPPAIQMPPMRNVGRPSQDRFSINQQLPMGLF